MPATRPETLGFIDHAAVSATVSADVAAAPADVFAVLADAEGWSRWFPGMTGGRWTTPAPHGVGSERVVHVGPAKVEERFIAWEEGELFAFTFSGANLPLAKAGVERITLTSNGPGTTVSYTMAVDPPLPVGPLANGLEAVLRGVLRRALKGLDQHLRA